MCLLMFNLLYWTKKKTNLIELKSMFQTHQKEVKLVKIFPTGATVKNYLHTHL